MSNWAERGSEIPAHTSPRSISGTTTPAGALSGDSRVCLRPAACPFARRAPGASWDVRRWAHALGEVIPGDADLVIDLLGLLIPEPR